jgi:signal transduction histidine kinase
MALILVGFLRNKHQLTTQGQKLLWEEAYQEGTRLSHIAEHLLRKGLVQTTDLEMSYIGMSAKLGLAVIVNDENEVRHASQIQWRGIKLEETPLARVRPFLDKARAEMSGRVMIAPGEKHLWAVFPFFDRTVSSMPAVILAYDLESVLKEARLAALHESLAQSLGLLSSCVVLWMFLDMTITRRIARIVAYAKEVAEGRHPPAPVLSGDEIGAVGMAFGEAVNQLRRTELQLLEASELERRRLGMDLHDDVCQRIAAAQLKAGVLGRALSKEDSSHKVFAAQMAQDLADAADIARGCARGLAPASLDRDGLKAALRDMSTHLGKLFNVPISHHTDVRVQELPEALQVHLFRIAQELATNAAKHAGATFIKIRLEIRESLLILEVENDGKAFALAAARKNGMGLHLVQQRIRAVEGRLRFQERPEGGGTLAVCEVPVAGMLVQ